MGVSNREYSSLGPLRYVASISIEIGHARHKICLTVDSIATNLEFIWPLRGSHVRLTVNSLDRGHGHCWTRLDAP